MNLQQLEYILAVNTHKNFVEAAEHCNITQATLSMMIRKLEDELGVEIFDRSHKPVSPTKIGQLILDQAATVLHESAKLKGIAKADLLEVGGTFSLAIIPTIAPYLLHNFISNFLNKYPKAHLKIEELQTSAIITALKKNTIDGAIMATPIAGMDLHKTILYYESFLLYAAADEKVLRKKYVLPKDLDINRMWFLEEGHCFRTQTGSLCELIPESETQNRLQYEAGSIESIIKIIDHGKGITLIPELAAENIRGKRKNQIRHFKSPSPVREISLVTPNATGRRAWLNAIKSEIQAVVPAHMLKASRKEIVEIKG